MLVVDAGKRHAGRSPLRWQRAGFPAVMVCVARLPMSAHNLQAGITQVPVASIIRVGPSLS